MDKIREKSPTEITLERKLLTPYKESVNEKTPNTKYNFFKEKAKEIIEFHLTEDSSLRKILNHMETQELKKSMFKEEVDSPKLSSSFQKQINSKKFKENLQGSELFQNEILGQSEFLKIKELMMKQNISLENTIESIKKIKKPLIAIRSSNSKDYTNNQIGEIEEISAYLSKEIEKTASSFRDVLRLIEQLSKISALEKAETKRAMKEDMEEALNRTKMKYENQMKALIQHNKELSSNKKQNNYEDKHKEKILQLQSSLKSLTESYNESIENLKRKNIENEKLQNKINSLNDEIEHLDADIENLKNIIKSQQFEDSSQSQNFRAEMNYMRDMLNKSKTELEISKKKDTGKHAINEREIERLKSEAKILENQLQEALNHMRKGDELARIEIQDLQRENRRLEEESKANNQRYKEEIEILHRELQDKDKQLRMEREKLITEIDMKEELKKIHSEMEEKEKELYLDRERLMSEIDAKEELRYKQKNEWERICDSLSLEIKTLKDQLSEAFEDKRKIFEESERDRQNKIQEEIKIKSQKEKLRDKLREQDMEIRKFWEVVKELQQINTAKGRIDFNDIRSLMNIKGLTRQIKRAQKTF